MQQATWLGLFLPLLSFLIMLAGSRVLSRRAAAALACGSVCASFICFCGLLGVYTGTDLRPQHYLLFQWIPVPQINADFAVTLDPLSLVMAMIITGVGFLIHVYSIGYMEYEGDAVRYFACLNFFVFAMLLLVLAANLLLLFIGWEGVGLASYLLIGFWYQRPAAARAAQKAFVVNRIGDLGLLLGILLTLYLFGTSDITTISRQATQQFAVGAPILTIMTLLYFVGAVGKSAQLPLHTWLPDAMEGPTPVSALIHAATMVTAGVYLVVRLHELFILAPLTLYIILGIGTVTALFAALAAVGQGDLKRVLAYSTISQLGYMFVACGVGAFYAAMFHLTTHAFVKALLFLSAGNVVHQMHGETQMAKMGGLARTFPKTQLFFLIGVLALSGIPPLSAFFSKDLILEQEAMVGFHFLFWVGLITSILTAFYLMRAYCLTFIGPTHAATHELKEAPSVMLIPVGILALLSIVGGLLGFGTGKMPLMEGFLGEIDVRLATGESSSLFQHPETWLSIVGSFLGIATALFVYGRYANQLGAPLALFRKAFYVDSLYGWLIVHPLRVLSQGIAAVLEPKLFEGSLRVLVKVTYGSAAWLQKMQSGQLRSYIAWMTVGLVLMTIYLMT
jgi:NADH-quinone oxidoreductase subunit L